MCHATSRTTTHCPTTLARYNTTCHRLKDRRVLEYGLPCYLPAGPQLPKLLVQILRYKKLWTLDRTTWSRCPCQLLLFSLLPLQLFLGVLCALSGVVDSLLFRWHGLEKIRNQCVAKNYCFRLRHAQALAGFCIYTASGISPRLRRRRRSWHGRFIHATRSLHPKVLLNEPTNAGSTQARSAMFENASFSVLAAF
jgi:hypothetical protein